MPPTKLTAEQKARLATRDRLMTERRQLATRDRLMQERAEGHVNMPAESGRRPGQVARAASPASPTRYPGGQRARRSGSSLGRRR